MYLRVPVHIIVSMAKWTLKCSMTALASRICFVTNNDFCAKGRYETGSCASARFSKSALTRGLIRNTWRVKARLLGPRDVELFHDLYCYPVFTLRRWGLVLHFVNSIASVSFVLLALRQQSLNHWRCSRCAYQITYISSYLKVERLNK